MVCHLCSPGVKGVSPWAENPAEGAGNLLEFALGPYTSGLLEDWQLLVGVDAEGAAVRVAAKPDVWTDGSLVEDKVSGAASSGSLFFTCYTGSSLGPIVGGTILMNDVGGDMAIGSCRGFRSVPGPSQSVQRG